jgi:predicted TIM-barrel fold metal-dependent hydrolase
LVGDDAYLAGLALLDKYDLTYDIHLTVEQLPAAAACLDKAPASLRVVINHIACGPRLGQPSDHADADEEAQWSAWRSGLAAVAKRPNTFIKLSAPTVVHAKWNSGDADARTAAKQAMKEAAEIFGPERCIVASNFPVDKVFAPCTAREAYELIFEAVSETVEGDDAKLKRVFHDNAVSVYKVGKTE